MANDPADVMRKHLKEELVPPDHINTSLSAGISEVIEIMMAKKRTDRYNNIEELLGDLEAIRNGQPPVRAHKRFDVSELKQLEAGEEIVTEHEDVYQDETITRYRIMVLILGAVAVISFLIIVFLLTKNQ